MNVYRCVCTLYDGTVCICIYVYMKIIYWYEIIVILLNPSFFY